MEPSKNIFFNFTKDASGKYSMTGLEDIFDFGTQYRHVYMGKTQVGLLGCFSV